MMDTPGRESEGGIGAAIRGLREKRLMLFVLLTLATRVRDVALLLTRCTSPASRWTRRLSTV